MIRAKILVILEHYLPGFRSGGPLRTVANMVDRLSDEFDFWILTRDRDPGDEHSFSGVHTNQWNRVGKGNVYYATPRQLSPFLIRTLVQQVKPDVIYLNSFFSQLTRYTVAARRRGLLGEIPVVMAPRGEFSPGALELKSLKKDLYLRVASLLGLYRNMIWQASSSREEDEIRMVWGRKPIIKIAADIATIRTTVRTLRPAKTPGSAKFVFLSRVSPKKNLLRIIDWLSKIKGDVQLDIYGPIRADKYWKQCCEAMGRAETLRSRYVAAIEPEKVAETLSEYHFFILPTLGENFGHAILEALHAGLPVIISDQTPWLGLEKHGVGWDLPLDSESAWLRVLEHCVNMNDESYEYASAQASRFAQDWISSPDTLEANIQLFRSAVKPSM